MDCQFGGFHRQDSPLKSAEAPVELLITDNCNRDNRSKSKVIRPRAKLACKECRRRKVRCLTVSSRSICMYCLHKQIECIPANSSEGQFADSSSASSAALALPPTRTTIAPCLYCTHIPPSSWYKTLDANSTVISTGISANNVNVKGGFDVWTEIYESYFGQDIQHSTWNFVDSGISSSDSTTSFTNISEASWRDEGDSWQYQHPSNIFKTFPPHLQEEEITYLRDKGALEIPVNPLRDILVQCFILYKHPQIPILSLDEVRGLIQDDVGNKPESEIRMSILLFQTIMLTGLACVSLQTLSEAGYTSREAAQVSFFNRVKLLYDFDCEKNCISIVQSLLLLSTASETYFDTKGREHWLAMAISLGYAARLNQCPSPISKMSADQYSQRKRIWWSCIIQDHQIAMRDGTKTQIKREDCCISMLDISDFPPDNNLCASNKLREQEIARRFIEDAMLCWCTGYETTSYLTPEYHMASQDDSDKTSIRIISTHPNQTSNNGHGIFMEYSTPNLFQTGSTVGSSWKEVDMGCWFDSTVPNSDIEPVQCDTIPGKKFDNVDFDDMMEFLEHADMETIS